MEEYEIGFSSVVSVSSVVKMPFEPTVLYHIALQGGSEGFEVWATGSAGQKPGDFRKVVDALNEFS